MFAAEKIIRWVPAASAALFILAGVPVVPAQQRSAAEPKDGVEAQALVRRAVDANLEQDKHHRPMRYTLRKIDDRQDVTKDIIETEQGDVARMVARDGKPLSPEDTQAEMNRLNNLLAHPEQEDKRRRAEIHDRNQVDHLIGMLPDAFLFTPMGETACSSGTCYRISFTPNPKFSPPDLEAGLFRGCAGEVWIDRAQGRMTRLDVHFIADVQFGLGILAKLNKGGTALIEQIDAGARPDGFHDWEVSSMTLNLTGRALMVKSMNVKLKQELTHFEPSPAGLDYRSAIKMLQSEGREVASR
jgi:hypothetical protein